MRQCNLDHWYHLIASFNGWATCLLLLAINCQCWRDDEAGQDQAAKDGRRAAQHYVKYRYQFPGCGGGMREGTRPSVRVEVGLKSFRPVALIPFGTLSVRRLF